MFSVVHLLILPLGIVRPLIWTEYLAIRHFNAPHLANFPKGNGHPTMDDRNIEDSEVFMTLGH